jgi:hypothetical protein
MSNKLIPKGIKRTPTIVVREHSATVVINDALSIINDQVQRLRVKSSSGFSLEAEEVKNLRSYVQSLVELSREDRERERHDGIDEFLEKLTEEDLLKYYAEKNKQIEPK